MMPRKKKDPENPQRNDHKVLDWKSLEKLCALHCTGEECAAVLGVSYDILIERIKSKGYKNFSEYFNEKSANGKVSLRKKQYDTAMEGNTTMLIWLGKQMLKQQDLSRQEIQAKVSTASVAEIAKDMDANEAAIIYKQFMGGGNE